MGKYIPISKIEERKTKLSENHFNSGYYPLFESYNRKENYNYENLRESAYRWNNYSPNVADNFSRILELFDIVKENNNGTQLQEFTNIINNHIIPYIKSPSVFKNNILKRLDEDSNNVYLTSILDKINEQEECDRVIRNHNMISKRFNIDKLVSQNILFEDAVTDTIYKLCELVDTYNLDFKSKFCIANEMALYTINKYAGDTISPQTIFENVTDYYLINGGTNNIPKFLNKIKEATKADDFINESNTSYIDKLERIHSNFINGNFDEDYYSGIMDRYRGSNIYGIEEAANQLEFAEFAIASLCEGAVSDKIKDMITAFKMAPEKTISGLKEIIKAIYVTTREEDLKKNTKNALSVSYYFLCTLSAVPAGPIAVVLSLISSSIVSKISNKIYLKSCISEWKDHRAVVNRKIKDEKDPQKKRRLISYLGEVDKNIEKLEAQNEVENKTFGIGADIRKTTKLDPKVAKINAKFEKKLHECLLSEATTEEKIDDIVDKFKALPVKSVMGVRSAIHAILITSRLEDIKAGTKNSLSLLFYSTIVIGVCSISSAAGILAFITSYIVSSHLNKEYLVSSIKEWKDHKYSITRKIKEEQNSEKRRELEKYLDEVEDNIDKLEDEYEKVRDKTREELDKDQDDKETFHPETIKSSSLINPSGNETPQLKRFSNDYLKKDDNLKKKYDDDEDDDDPDFDDDEDFGDDED